MRKKILYLLITAVLFSILINACAKENQGDEEKVKIIEENIEKKDVTMATKDFLMEIFDLTEEEVKEILVEEIIIYDQLTEEDLLNLKLHFVDSSYFIKYLKDIQNKMEEEKKIKEEYGTIDYTYVLEAKEYEEELPDIDSIRYLVDAYNIADGGYSCVIDFKKDKVYYNPYNAGVYDDIRFAENVINLTPEIEEEIISLLKEVKLGEWDYRYDYRGEDGEECFWEFGVEFNDGTIISNVGIRGSSPKGYKTLRDELYDKILKNY